jgi:hypothetical protein
LTTLSGIAELVVYRAVLTFTGKMWLSIVIDVRVLNEKKGKELVNTSVLMSCSFRVGILVEPLQLRCFHILETAYAAYLSSWWILTYLSRVWSMSRHTFTLCIWIHGLWLQVIREHESDRWWDLLQSQGM